MVKHSKSGCEGHSGLRWEEEGSSILKDIFSKGVAPILAAGSLLFEAAMAPYHDIYHDEVLDNKITVSETLDKVRDKVSDKLPVPENFSVYLREEIKSIGIEHVHPHKEKYDYKHMADHKSGYIYPGRRVISDVENSPDNNIIIAVVKFKSAKDSGYNLLSSMMDDKIQIGLIKELNELGADALMPDDIIEGYEYGNEYFGEQLRTFYNSKSLSAIVGCKYELGNASFFDNRSIKIEIKAVCEYWDNKGNSVRAHYKAKGNTLMLEEPLLNIAKKIIKDLRWDHIPITKKPSGNSFLFFCGVQICSFSRNQRKITTVCIISTAQYPHFL